MPRYSLSFRVDPHPKAAADMDPDRREDLEQALRLPLYKEFGLKVYSVAWVSADMDWSGWPALLERMRTLGDAGEAVFGSGILDEAATEDELADSEWFLIQTAGVSGDFSLMEPYPTCKAFQLPPGKHILERHFVSEKFREVVESHGLTGLDFLWVQDKGKYQARQWYSAIAREALGHGIDHEALDRPAYEGGGHKLHPLFKYGVLHFDNRYLKSGWSTGHAHLDDALARFPRDCLGLILQSQRYRFLRSKVPSTDFAYCWAEPDARVQGQTVRFRDLCVNRRGRDALVNAGLLKPSDLIGIQLLDAVPEGTANLDDAECPGPVYDEKDWPRMRQEEAKRYAVFQEKEQPRREPDFKRALKLLKQAKKGAPDRFPKPPSVKKRDGWIDAFDVDLPQQWRQVLSVTDGGDWSEGETVTELAPLAGLAQLQAEGRRQMLAMDSEATDRFFFLGHNDCGDLYALEGLTAQPADDCPVVLVSHETMDVETRWASIADFMESILMDL